MDFNSGIHSNHWQHKSPVTTERYLKTLGLDRVKEALEDMTGKGVGKRISLRLVKGSKNSPLKKKPSREPSPKIYAHKQEGKSSIAA